MICVIPSYLGVSLSVPFCFELYVGALAGTTFPFFFCGTRAYCCTHIPVHFLVVATRRKMMWISLLLL